MKVKIDFVSNSSSTSFVYIAQGVLAREEFFDAVGVKASSPAVSLFEDMFDQLRYRIERGSRVTSIEEIDDLKEKRVFTPEVLAKMRDAIQQGTPVITGEFSSEENLAESILCMEIFEIESERFFINAYDNYW